MTTAAAAQTDTGADDGGQTGAAQPPASTNPGASQQQQGQQQGQQQQQTQPDLAGQQQQQDPAGQPGTQQQQGQQNPAPEDIQDFTMPEGMSMDAEVGGELKAFAKEHGLNQEQAQQIADMGAKLLIKQQQAFEETKTQWAEAARTDQEYGGENFNANLDLANKALKAFGSPGLVALLEQTGLGNHPEMVRAWYTIGKELGEDRLVTGRSSVQGEPQTHAERMFPDMSKPT